MRRWTWSRSQASPQDLVPLVHILDAREAALDGVGGTTDEMALGLEVVGEEVLQGIRAVDEEAARGAHLRAVEVEGVAVAAIPLDISAICILPDLIRK
jgi:hypothetical protein